MYSAKNPYDFFKLWYQDAVSNQTTGSGDPNAMTLATSTREGKPSARIVLFKGFSKRQGLLFVTNYESRKGQELEQNPFAALVFYWPTLDRQVRVEGKIEKVSEVDSDSYWKTRPRESQIGAWASEQSKEIESRNELEKRAMNIIQKYEGNEIPRPPHWGGFELIPEVYEFWQARAGRLHDRVRHVLIYGQWKSELLSP